MASQPTEAEFDLIVLEAIASSNMRKIRIERNRLADIADYKINDLIDRGLDPQLWRNYRLKLRAIPQTYSKASINDVTWPAFPIEKIKSRSGR